MIKTSLFIATPDMPEVSYVHLYKGEIEENVKKAMDAGFDGVELITPDPDVFEWDRLDKALKKYNSTLACINSGRLKSEYGVTLIHPDKAIQKKAVEKFQSIIRAAARFKCYANIGIFRGPAIDGKPVKYTFDMFVEILQGLCDYAAGYGVGINFEPTNRYEINFINSTKDGLAVIEKVNKPNLGLLLDLFHMNLEDDDMLSMIVYCRNLVKHFHFTDTDRWPAGNSHGLVDFPQLISILKLIGYNGFLSQNLVRSEEADACAKRTASYLHNLIN